MHRCVKQTKGFTLVELIIVIAVALILSASVFFIVNPTKRIGQTNDARRLEDVTAIAKAVELYQIDNDALPTTLATANVNVGHKKVLCSSAATLSCDGQARACLVLNDADLLNNYLGGALPVDPTKTSTADTGYYIGRSGDKMIFGACDTYEVPVIEYIAKASLGVYSTTCGDGDTEGSEVCDDGDTTTETQTCNNGILETGSHCNATCSAEITLTEVCDDGGESCGDGVKQSGTFCNDTCTAVNKVVSEVCDYTGLACSEAPIAPHAGAVGCPSAPYCNEDCSACSKTCPLPPA